jgi:hypothetical protein
MKTAKQSAVLPENLPLLTEVVGEDAKDNFPVLTEIVAEFKADADLGTVDHKADISLSCAISGEEMQKLLQCFEAHFEAVLTQKLSLHIEQLQRQAIEQAVSELKTALPELLRNALSANSR